MDQDESVLRPRMSRTIPKDCANSGYRRKIHDATVWRYLQDVYIDTVDNMFSNQYEERKALWPSYSGFLVQVEVRDGGRRGRSIYAMEPIAKGTKVWKHVHLAQFHTPAEFRAFLSELDHDLQCDALLWSYVEKGEGYVALALDPASFVNHGETEDVVNLDENCVALRDIEMGEELLENYSHFIGFEENEVEWFHRIRGVAWKEDGPSTRSHSTDEYNLLGAPKVWGDDAEFREQIPRVMIVGVLAMCALWMMKKILRTNAKKAKCSV